PRNLYRKNNKNTFSHHSQARDLLMAANKQRLIYFASSVIALSAGIFCYYIFRDFNMIFFQIFKIKVSYANVRAFSDNFFINFIRYNLCDGLWLLSGILFLRFLWFSDPVIGGYYIKFFIGLALLLELLQLIKYFPGTFDIFDIFTMAFFALLEHFINIFFTIRRRQK
ncbi:hypothetical protein, partial [Treponema sp. R80B11-R83G3]